MWIYIPDISHSTQVADNSTKDLNEELLNSVCQNLSQSVTWNETFKQHRFWLTKYKQEKWVKHLYGLIPQPSTATSLVIKWMQSLVDFPANHLALQETKKVKKMKDGSGKILKDWLFRYDQNSCSWKTSQVSLLDMD